MLIRYKLVTKASQILTTQTTIKQSKRDLPHLPTVISDYPKYVQVDIHLVYLIDHLVAGINLHKLRLKIRLREKRREERQAIILKLTWLEDLNLLTNEIKLFNLSLVILVSLFFFYDQPSLPIVLYLQFQHFFSNILIYNSKSLPNLLALFSLKFFNFSGDNLESIPLYFKLSFI